MMAEALPQRQRVRAAAETPARERPLAVLVWYRLVQHVAGTIALVAGGIRVSGRHEFPRSGGVLLISNHLSHLDVFVLGISQARPLNYVARSSLFLPVLGILIRSVGGFPIRREGMGAEGLKETLRRLRAGGIVTLFPEGTRSATGDLGPLKSGIAVLAARARVPIVTAGIAGTFEALPRGRSFPRRHPVWIHYGPPIWPEEIAGRDDKEVTELLRARILESQAVARRGLSFAVGRLAGFG
jgi:1-acyl-sn-glycerol-3-phosphate acyltransferase